MEENKDLTVVPEMQEDVVTEVDEITEQEMVSEEETYREMSPFGLIMRRFFRSKLSVVGLIMIVFLILFSFLGPVVYRTWGEQEEDRTKIITHYSDVQSSYYYDNGKFVSTKNSKYKGSKDVIITITERVTIEDDLNRYADPSLEHPLGTDDQGYDVLVRLMYGDLVRRQNFAHNRFYRCYFGNGNRHNFGRTGRLLRRLGG